jgi:hypothetical protein
VPAHNSFFRGNRAEAQARAGDHARAFAEANALASAVVVTGGACYDLARVCAIAAAFVKDDPRLREQYTNRAVELLRQAVDKGFKDAARLKQDKDLETLRNREDFKKLLVELEKAAPN